MGKQATKALDVVTSAGIEYKVHKYEHDSAHESFGLEAAEKLDIEPGRVFKTLIASVNDKLAVAIVPVDKQLDLKTLAATLSAKHASMAEVSLAERTTGYVVGAISPLGQKKLLPTVIDESALQYETINVSAGKRGMEIELSANDLATLTNAKIAVIAR